MKITAFDEESTIQSQVSKDGHHQVLSLCNHRLFLTSRDEAQYINEISSSLKKEVLTHTKTEVSLENFMLIEISQMKKDKCCMIYTYRMSNS